MKKFLNLIPDITLINKLIIYISSVYFHKSITFYFSNTLNGYMLRTKSLSHDLDKYVNKLSAKDFINKKVGKDYVIKTIKIHSIDDKNFPNGSWAFKSNNDFAGALLYSNDTLSDAKKTIIKDPIHNPSKEQIKYYLDIFIKRKTLDPFRITREACYKNIRKEFFFEELIPNYKFDRSPVNEYKFHVVNGKVNFIYITVDRLGLNKRIIVDRNGKLLNVSWCKKNDMHKFSLTSFTVSNNFLKMYDIAEKIASEFIYARIDIYDSDPAPKVGEITFYHGSGLERFSPNAFDYKIGKLLNRY